jgi:alpha-tubulin suppressor-like RCC1 family protein
MWGFNTAQTNFPSIWYNAVARSNPTQIDGLYATTAAATKVPIRSGNSSWTQVEAGNSFSSGLYYRTAGVNGLLYTWGLNSIGQLGLNDTINRSSPVQIGQNTFLSTTVGTSNTGAIGKAT